MITLLALALALSMDAFAAALCDGSASRPRASKARALYVGLAFGGAQALMPLIGYGLGLAFVSVVREVDHWIAFVLLSVLGVRMMREGLRPSPSQGTPAPRGQWALFATTIATSIDAAAAGVTLPMLGQPVLLACAVIGVVTFALSAAGVLIGAAAGAAAGHRATILGGVMLVGIGSKILVEHLFFGG